MQMMVFLLIFAAIAAFIIYKINNKFEVKEGLLLLGVLVLGILAIILFIDKKEETVPNIFKAQYEKETSSKILKFSAKRLNNKNLSSSSEFIYTFDYIVNKNDKEFVCTIENISIKKIEDEYIIDKYKENCKEK